MLVEQASTHPPPDPLYREKPIMLLTFEAAPAPAMPANDDALVAQVVAAQAAQAAHFAVAEAARAAQPVYASFAEFEAAGDGWEAM